VRARNLRFRSVRAGIARCVHLFCCTSASILLLVAERIRLGIRSVTGTTSHTFMDDQCSYASIRREISLCRINPVESTSSQSWSQWPMLLAYT